MDKKKWKIAKWIIKNEFLMNANPLIHSRRRLLSLLSEKISQTKRIQDRVKNNNSHKEIYLTTIMNWSEVESFKKIQTIINLLSTLH